MRNAQYFHSRKKAKMLNIINEVIWRRILTFLKEKTTTANYYKNINRNKHTGVAVCGDHRQFLSNYLWSV